MVTSGALAAWDLLLRTVTRPGQRALVEQPTYAAALDAVAANHLRPVPLPVGAEGWELPVAAADVALLTPDGQNPTGLLADDAQRRALLAAVDAPVLAVDETFTELVLDGAPGTRWRTRPPGGDPRVDEQVYWAGLRVGWVRADPPLLARLAQMRGTIDLSSPVLEQLVAVRLLAVAEEVLADRVGWLTAAGTRCWPRWPPAAGLAGRPAAGRGRALGAAARGQLHPAGRARAGPGPPGDARGRGSPSTAPPTGGCGCRCRCRRTRRGGRRAAGRGGGAGGGRAPTAAASRPAGRLSLSRRGPAAGTGSAG